MSFINVKKQYLAIAMLVFVLLFLFNSKPAFQCQFSPEEGLAYLPVIYGITPTYARLSQKADLTRLSQTLMLVKNFHWIVIEDAETKTKLVTDLLKESNLKYTHLNVKTHKAKHSMDYSNDSKCYYDTKNADETTKFDCGKSDLVCVMEIKHFGYTTPYYCASGVEQRNVALNWLRGHLKKEEDKKGVVYFMDDDNTYALKVFDEMRKIKKVGVWPVGIVGGMRVEMPLVSNNKVSGFNAVWKPFRPFPIDMAGFAINSTLFLKHPEAKFTRKVQSGYQESEILMHFTKKEELEPLAENCTKVYVWHTRTQKPSILTSKKGKPVPEELQIEV